MQTRRLVPTFLITAVVAGVSLSTLVGCGSDDKPYKPKPAYSGTPVSLPPPPTLPKKPVKVGGNYTVWGAIHHRRSRIHSSTVVGKELTIVGVIGETNFAKAPKCAVHRKGKKDGKECEKTPPPVPKFTLCEKAGDKAVKCIDVMGFASNWAAIFDAIKEYKKPGRKKDAEPVQDELWGVPIPNPLPVAGAKVKVTGQFGTVFDKASSGIQTNPLTGIITFKKIEYVEPPTKEATLPGMKLVK